MEGFKKLIKVLIPNLPRRERKKTTTTFKENILLVNARKGQLCIISNKGETQIEKLITQTEEINTW